MPQDVVFAPHQPDHIVAEQHGGETDIENLALACIHCNRQKGPNIASIDPISKQLTQLFNPRIHSWGDHFVLESAHIRALTSVGRVTIQVLALNAPERLEVRQTLIEEDRYP